MKPIVEDFTAIAARLREMEAPKRLLCKRCGGFAESAPADGGSPICRLCCGTYRHVTGWSGHYYSLDKLRGLTACMFCGKPHRWGEE